jgi:hypothetical protein
MSTSDMRGGGIVATTSNRICLSVIQTMKVLSQSIAIPRRRCPHEPRHPALRLLSLESSLMLKVQSKACTNCIYRKDSPLDLKELEAQIADPHMTGFFVGHRICHHSKDACCRGFWSRHRNHFTLGQISQRMNAVEFVEVQ